MMDRLAITYSGTINLFRFSLQRHMPSSPYKEFQSWAISKDNPHFNTWEQIVGIPQFAKLTFTLLDGLTTDDKWETLIEYASWMNAYLIYETVSDNLAIGLANQHSPDKTASIRRHILRQFDAAMICALQGNREEAIRTMNMIREDVAHISTFSQSLTNEELRAMASLFVKRNDHYNVEDVEYDVWAALVANIEACVDVVERLKGTQLADYLQQGLIWRYDAVNRLLNHRKHSAEEVLSISTHSILVIPVLTYYIAVLKELLEQNPAIKVVHENGLLHQALSDAALMVRLLNDLGTPLLVSSHDHAALFNNLYEQSQHYMNGSRTLGEFLLEMASTNPLLTRIHKDLAFGEFNVSLQNIAHLPLSPETLLLFGTNVIFLHHRYAQCRRRLEKNLSILEAELGDSVASQLIQRFVDFHEYIYGYRFDSQAGDYATKPDKRFA